MSSILFWAFLAGFFNGVLLAMRDFIAAKQKEDYAAQNNR